MTDHLATRVQGVLDVPLHRALGLRLLDDADPPVGLAIAVEGLAVNNVGVLHGGVLTALLDVASYLAVLPTLAPEENAVTHDVTASVMRPVAEGEELRVAGTVVRRGRSIAFLRAEAHAGGRIVAAAQVTKSIVGG